MSRPEILFPLFASIDSIAGVGEKTSKALGRLGIERIKDLIFHLPHSAIERVKPKGRIANYLGKYIILEGVIGGHRAGRSRAAPYRVRFMVGKEDIDLTFFRAHATHIAQILPMGETRVISGKLERYGEGFQIIHPDHIGETDVSIPKIEPQYGLSEGLTQKLLTKTVHAALARAETLPEWLRKDVKKNANFPSWLEALSTIHFPKSAKDVDFEAPARRRLAYDELLSHQLALALVRADKKTPRGKQITLDQGLIARARGALPFALTGAQERVTGEIFEDFQSDKRMFRLVQGDVGSGKTAVAFLAMAAVVGAGFQAALLAPTEILARQHFNTLSQYFENIGIKSILVVGADKSKARKLAETMMADGTAQVIIGTHAIFQDAAVFANLGLAVIDEQHRFGVMERKRLSDKGVAVDLLALSATPIPRSLAMAVYGEMDLSILDEKPSGRTPIETSLLSAEKLDILLERLNTAVASERQIYWVCPLVSESEVLDFTAAKSRYGDLSARLGFEKVGMVHGRMEANEKSRVMEAFRQGEIAVLVATTVIEVGVDVPNASIMIIEGAERFGLSQLHQLRGRVGRGAAKSNCILLYGDQIGQVARERLELMRESDDGFYLADADMRMRGAGDLIGTAQSGLPRFKIADLEQHQDLLSLAHDDAKALVNSDPKLETDRGKALRVLLYLSDRDQSVSLLGKA